MKTNIYYKLVFKIKEPKEVVGKTCNSLQQTNNRFQCSYFYGHICKNKTVSTRSFQLAQYLQNSGNIPTNNCFEIYWFWDNTTSLLKLVKDVGMSHVNFVIEAGAAMNAL